MTRPFTIWGGIGGENGVFPTQSNQDPVRSFLDRCAEAGVTRFIPGYIPGQETCLRYDHGKGEHSAGRDQWGTDQPGLGSDSITGRKSLVSWSIYSRIFPNHCAIHSKYFTRKTMTVVGTMDLEEV